MDWYQVLDQLPNQGKPQLLLNLNALEFNIEKIASKNNGKKIRIASKSIRSTAVMKKILASHDAFQGVMCFTAAEAIHLVNQGIDDILIGYPSMDAAALKEIALKNKEGYSICCMVDSQDQVYMLSTLAEQVNGLFYICIDMDMSTNMSGVHFGVRRSPLQKPKEVSTLANKILKHQTLCLKGIMGYEAQIAGVADKQPNQKWKNKLIYRWKMKSLPLIGKQRRKVYKQLTEKDGVELSFFNGGGTGSLHSTTKEEVITEVTVGSGFYSPLLFDNYHDISFQPALYFSLPIVRIPKKGIYTCLGGGYIASGSIGKDKQPEVIFPEDGRLLFQEGAGEVQTPVRTKNTSFQIGDSMLFRAAKAGEICERFSVLALIENGKYVGEFLTYRGEGVCFL